MGPLAPEAVLGGRYQLDHLAGDDGLTQVWAATDEVLARRVVVEAISASAPAGGAAAFTASAAAAARLVHPAVVATYDSGTVDGLPYIVTERPSGPTLAELVERQGPVTAARAVRIGRQLARALEAAHRLGVAHGDVTPRTVLVSDDDRVKLSRFAAAGAAARLAGDGTDPRLDVRGAGRTVTAALIGSPAADGGPAVSARAARPGVPRALDDILVAAQEGRIGDASSLAVAFEGLDLDDDAVPHVERDPTPRLGTPVTPPPFRPPGSRTSAAAGVAVGLLLAIALGVAAFIISTQSGTPSPEQGGAPTTAPGEGRGGNLAIASAQSFNPLGDGPEHVAALGNLTDGDPSTAWTTQAYASRSFGGLKAGDGVFVTLSGVHPLHQLTVWSPDRGWTFSVYVADRPGGTLAAWGAPVAGPTTVQSDPTPVDLGGRSAGAVLVWITQLPGSAPYRASIGELTVR